MNKSFWSRELHETVEFIVDEEDVQVIINNGLESGRWTAKTNTQKELEDLLLSIRMELTMRGFFQINFE